MKLDGFKPNMIILDEVSSYVGGVEVCSYLHNAFGIPIILLGKDSSGKGWIKAVEAGADFYLIKPFSYLELVARMKTILRRYKKRYHHSLSTDKEVMPIEAT